MLETAVDKVRQDVGEEQGEDCGRNGPCTLVAADAKAELEVDEDGTDVEVIVLLLRARHEDDRSADRVAVHAAQDAILFYE